jgi:hypothetical protein
MQTLQRQLFAAPKNAASAFSVSLFWYEPIQQVRVAWLARLMGFDVTVTSELGKGSGFTVRLSAAKS